MCRRSWYKLDLFNCYGIYLCHKWPRSWSVCRNQNVVLSSFITYHRVCNKSSTTCATSGAGGLISCLAWLSTAQTYSYFWFAKMRTWLCMQSYSFPREIQLIRLEKNNRKYVFCQDIIKIRIGIGRQHDRRFEPNYMASLCLLFQELCMQTK